MRTTARTKRKTESSRIKTSFAPVSSADTTYLILGTIPGDRSLELNQYYGHPQNRFWKMIAYITNQPLPVTYDEKKQVLLNARIGVWDVAHKADRKGSLDSNIKAEIPNDLNYFLAMHKNIRTISFNGKTAEKLYDKYFERIKGITYLPMPSTSPANAGITFDDLCEKWKQILVV